MANSSSDTAIELRRQETDVPEARTVPVERTAQMQAGSSTNTWFKGNTDPGWVFGYDANTAPLAAMSAPVT